MILQELQTFARRHGLPAPAIGTDADGDHAFLFSTDKSRRYAYALTWERDKQHLLWVMLNPGTGESEGRRRNTFERCKQWSNTMGYGGLIFGNVFSLRSKAAKDLLRMPHAADDLNKQSLALLSRLAPSTIVAWGNHGAKSEHPASLQTVLTNPKCFGYTKSGQPRHPLYVASNTPLVEWPRISPAPSEA